MKLIYRGSTYNYDPARVQPRRPFPHPEQSAYKLIYRGNTYRFDPAIAKLASVKPDSYQLIYRGSTYQVNRNKVGKTVNCPTIAIAPPLESFARKFLHKTTLLGSWFLSRYPSDEQ
jgi:Domain of unknown function (DUF4278)